MADKNDNRKEDKDNKDFWKKNKDQDKKDSNSGFDPISRLSGGRFRFSFVYFLIVLVGLAVLNAFLVRSPDSLIQYSDFKYKIESGEILSVKMTPGIYYGYSLSRAALKQQLSNGGLAPGSAQQVYKTIPVTDESFIPLLDEKGVEYYAEQEKNNYLIDILLTWVVPLLIFMVIWQFLFRKITGGMGSNVMSFGQNKSKIVAESDIATRFDDMAGADEAKEELVEVIDFLKKPAKYTEIGGKIPKGVLLVGPPGTGKTLLARAVAGEAEVTFFRMSGAEFVEMFVGVGAARVRDLFKQAREKAPCIIFIDELDAIGKSRAASLSTNDEREQTLNQLLVEMDGFDSTSGVIIIAATNRPEVLDPALLRPGRFDRQVLVDKPDLLGREAILNIHSRGVKYDDTIDLKDVARSTPGFVGADLANIINEAALLAVRAGRNKVSRIDFDEAIEKTIAGLQKRNRLINPREREIVAHHETGHAMVAAFTPDSAPVQKISIVPRGLGALGYTIQMPTEDRFLMTQEELLGEIDVLLGGRAAEKLIYNKLSTGASNDIQRATDIARNMIASYGMSEKFHNMTLTKKNGNFLEGGAGQKEYSESTQQYIDEEISRIIASRYDYVLGLLKKHLELLKKISHHLLDVEILSSEEFMGLLKDDDQGTLQLEERQSRDTKVSSESEMLTQKRNDAIIEKAEREEAARKEREKQRDEEERKKAEEASTKTQDPDILHPGGNLPDKNNL